MLGFKARTLRLAIIAGMAAMGIAACDKETTSPTMVVRDDVALAVNANVADAVAGIPFVFTGGAGALTPALTGANMTVTFGGTETATVTTFVISGSQTGTVTANTTYGSCVFAITASTFPAGHALSLGQTVTVNPCNLQVNSQGVVANGVGQTRSVALLLGAAASAGASVTINVTAGGQLSINGNAVATVTLTPVSG